MKLNLYTIHDKVAIESGPIFQAKNDAVAYRQFQQILSKAENTDDYELLCVGEFNTETRGIQGLLIGRLVEANISMTAELEKDKGI